MIAGEGELRPTLERQIKEHHLEKHVFLAGFRPDVLSLHKAFDIFVMSSVTEGLGTSLLDAMAAGKPIVATTTGGIPEVVVDGETGTASSRRATIARWPTAIVDAVEGSGRGPQHGRRRPRPRRSRQFSAERMLKETLRVYERVAIKRTTKSRRRKIAEARDARSILRLAASQHSGFSCRAHAIRSTAARPPPLRGSLNAHRGQSSNVTARPFSEKVMPRARRVCAASLRQQADGAGELPDLRVVDRHL